MPDPTTVLLVDDDFDCRSIYGRALSHAGYRVMEAATGARGLEIARAAMPAVCILDLGLPDMDGVEVTRLLRADSSTRRMVIAILTAYVWAADDVRVREAGCDLFIGKPILPRDLVTVIDRASHHTVPHATPLAPPAVPAQAPSQSPPAHPAGV